ncbi:ATP synthase subunit I [Sodalinema gerasimenkoae]|uniref:ATP synthase subunit I n=1 Tax=Sodalinema gerasimenkoae TaxID=2862348 RepID=UPI001FEC2A23|nr:ATP synthase subunit I [Sodalinema gerasimenkoae]
MHPRFDDNLTPLTTRPRFRRSDDEFGGQTSPVSSQPVQVSASPTPSETVAVSGESRSSDEEYSQLRKQLYMATLLISGAVFASLWYLSSRDVALNYSIGALVGTVYLRMMARDVERLGRTKVRLGNGRMALFIGLMVVATQVQQLQILPTFFGFMTYKVAILVHVLLTTFAPDLNSSRQPVNR